MYNPEGTLLKYQNKNRILILVKLYDWKFEPRAWYIATVKHSLTDGLASS